jgi:hypothetical protein
MTVLLPLIVFAQEDAPEKKGDLAIAGRIATTGYGLEVAKLLNGSVGLRAGFGYFRFSTSGSNSDIDYDIKARLHTVEALVDLFPSARGTFHFTAGMMTNPATVDMTGQPTGSGTFEINNHQYTAAQVGVLTGEGKFSSVLPYLGLGFGTPWGRRGAVKFRFDLGAAIGKPSISLSATGAASNPTLKADLEAQQATTQKDVRKIPVFPVLSIGLAVHL